MALPKPKSIFDEEHPVASTGATYAYPEGFRNVLGIAFPPRQGGMYQVMMRGSIKCPDSEAEEEEEEDDDVMRDVVQMKQQVVDDENDSIINKVTEFARNLRNWLDKNTVFVEKHGVLYAYGDVPLNELNVPRYEETLVMADEKKYKVTGGIKEIKVNYKGRSARQGEPLSYYEISLQVNYRACYPVFMSKNWR